MILKSKEKKKINNDKHSQMHIVVKKDKQERKKNLLVYLIYDNWNCPKHFQYVGVYDIFLPFSVILFASVPHLPYYCIKSSPQKIKGPISGGSRRNARFSVKYANIYDHLESRDSLDLLI